ncbi:amino acid permease-domain-containing protein [Chytridium lagenaria]|nr:amino acid permease-domain-containing protein [Chytridium lagenaria]
MTNDEGVRQRKVAKIDAEIADDARLNQLGYKQELSRALHAFSNFGITFTILSEPLSVLPLLYLGLLAGGPQGMLITWPVITLLSLAPATAMSEIMSSYPTSGGLYYRWDGWRDDGTMVWMEGFVWIKKKIDGRMGLECAASLLDDRWIDGLEWIKEKIDGRMGLECAASLLDDRWIDGLEWMEEKVDCQDEWAASLAGPRWSPFASYMTGYFNSLGLIGLCSGSGYAFGQFFTNVLALSGVTSVDTDIVGVDAMLPKVVIMVSAWMSLGLGAALACAPSRRLEWIGKASFWFNVMGMVGIVVGCFATSTVRVSPEFLYRAWNNGTGLPDGMAVVISILLATLTYTGYDSAAHLAEETNDPSVSGPRSIFMSIVGTFIGGYLALLGLLSTIDPTTYNDLGALGSYALTQIFLNTVGKAGAIVFNILLMFLAITNIFGLLLNHARQTFAFSRDGALPGSSWLHCLSGDNVPVRATVVIAVVDCVILVPSLYSSTLYYAINSFGVVGTYLAYAVPIALRVLHDDRFPRGKFSIGVWGRPVGMIAVVFLVISSVVIMMPTVYTDPAEFTNEEGVLDNTAYVKQYLQNFNWAPAMVFVVSFVAMVFWGVSARKWFKGPPIDKMTQWGVARGTSGVSVDGTVVEEEEEVVVERLEGEEGEWKVAKGGA